MQVQSQFLDYLIDPSFQGANRFFVSVRTGHTGYFLSKVEIKDYNAIIDGWNYYDQQYKMTHKRMATLGKLLQF